MWRPMRPRQPLPVARFMAASSVPKVELHRCIPQSWRTGPSMGLDLVNEPVVSKSVRERTAGENESSRMIALLSRVGIVINEPMNE